MQPLAIKHYHLIAYAAVLFCAWSILFLSGGQIADWIAHLRNIAAAAIFVLSSIAGGQTLLKILRYESGSTPPGILLSFTSGLIVYYLVTFLIGLLGGYHPLLLILLFYVPSFFLLLPILRSRWWSEALIVPGEYIAVYGAAWLIVFYCFVLSLTPVTHFDALTNHLGVPAEYLAKGRIVSLPHNLHANLPPAGQMICLMLLGGSSPDTVHLFNWMLTIFIGLAFWSLQHGTTGTGWVIGWMIFLTIPQISLLFNLTNIDFLTTLFCAVSVILYFQIRREGVKSYYLLLSFHLGFLLSLKYQAAIFVVSILSALVLMNRKEWRRFAFLIPGFLILVLPYLVKNLVMTGFPAYPFGSPSPEAQAFVSANSHMPADAALPDFLKAYGLFFVRQPETGLFVVAMGIIALRFYSTNWYGKSMLLWLGLAPPLFHCFISLNVVNLIRWVQYSLGFLSLLAGVCLAQWYGHNRKVLLALVVYVPVSFYLCFMLNLRLTGAVMVGAGRTSIENYRSEYIPSYELRKRVDSLDAPVLFIGESRGLLNAANATIPSAYNFLYLERYFQRVETTEDLRKAFLSDGYGYLFISRTGISRNLQNGRYSWLTRSKARLLWELAAQSMLVADDSRSFIVKL